MDHAKANGRCRALVISPESHISAELKGLLARDLPLSEVTALPAYPSRAGLADLGTAQLCFLDVSADPASAFTVMSTATVCRPEMAVVAVLRANDPDLILQCLRKGAAEFLIQPFTSDQLRAALGKMKRFHAPLDAPASGSGRIYCITPSKGACGATTLAFNLAFAFKQAGGKRTFVADLDGLTGTLAFLLKLKSNYSFVDALHQAGNLDADLWKALITPAQGIDVMLSPEDPVHIIGEAYDPAPLLAYARQCYEVVLLDTAGAYGDWNLTSARLADEVLVVTTNELPALYAAQRVLRYLENNGIERQKLRVIVNRLRTEMGLPSESIEAALRREVFHALPSDYAGIQRALMEGRAVPAGSEYGASVAALAARLAGHSVRERKRGLLAGLFGRRN